MAKYNELIALCDAGLNYLTQERQMYLARLEHYPDGIHGVEALKGALQAIDGCIDRLNCKRGEIVEQREKYQNSQLRWARVCGKE